MGDFGFELIKFLLDDLFVVREVGLEPFKGTSIVLGLKVFLKFVKLLIGHLIS